jgi:hypothetical protein
LDAPVKILLTWDIAPDHEQDYFEFVLGEYVPGIQRLGLQPSEAWVTVYGEYPQVQVGVLASSFEDAQKSINSQEWHNLHDKLFALVRNYACKIVPARGGFQF